MNTTDGQPTSRRRATFAPLPQQQRNPSRPGPHQRHINIDQSASYTLEPETVHGRQLRVQSAGNSHPDPYMYGYQNSYTSAPIPHPSESRPHRSPRGESSHTPGWPQLPPPLPSHYVQPQPYSGQTSFRPGIVEQNDTPQWLQPPPPPPPSQPLGPLPTAQIQTPRVAPRPGPSSQIPPPLSHHGRTLAHRIKHERRDSPRRTRNEHDRLPWDSQSDEKVDMNVLRVNIAQTTDITLHSKLEIVEDISVDLEQFSRLCRLGNFAAAKYHFMKNLHDHVDNLYVRVQYMQMLLESGDYKTLNSMKPISKSMFSGHKVLYRNYTNVMDGAMLHDNKSFPNVSNERDWEALKKRYMTSDNNCSSTEIQSLTIMLHNLAYTSRFRESPHFSLVRDIHNVMPYTDLLHKGQIWDYRDVLTGLIQSDPNLSLLPSLFGESDTVGLLDLNIKHLEADLVDQSTNLAILDITETILLAAHRPKDQFQRLLEKATTLVSSLVQDDPDLVASRQYLRWMLAKLSVEIQERLGMGPYSGSPGLFLTHYSVWCLPLYVPCESEMPTPFNVKLRPDRIPFIKTAIDGARSIQDHNTEVLCLQALIFETENPLAIFDELARLQKDTQGDMQGCLQTYLSRYVFCRDQSSRSTLRKDILSLRYSDNFPSVLLWARAMILRALAESTGEASSYLSLAARHAFTIEVPEKYRSFFTSVKMLVSSKNELQYSLANPGSANLPHDPNFHRPTPLPEPMSDSSDEHTLDLDIQSTDRDIGEEMSRHRHSTQPPQSAPTAISPRISAKKTSNNKLPGVNDIAVTSASSDDETESEWSNVSPIEHPTVIRRPAAKVSTGFPTRPKLSYIRHPSVIRRPATRVPHVIIRNKKADKGKTAARMAGHAGEKSPRRSPEFKDDTDSGVQVLSRSKSAAHRGAKSVSAGGSVSESDVEYIIR